MRHSYPIAFPLYRCAILIGLVLSVGAAQGRASEPAKPIVLPAAGEWATEAAEVRQAKSATEVVAPVNYLIGRVISPAVSARTGDGFTFAAEAHTRFPMRQSGFYRFWLQLEFLRDKEVIQTVASPELVDTQEELQLLAVSGFAPPETTAVRAVLCAQNKFWNRAENQAVVDDLRLLKLNGGPGQSLEIEVAKGLSPEGGSRHAQFVIRGDWPSGTGVAISTTRGTVSPTVLLVDGRAEFPISFETEDVGRAVVTAHVADQETSLQLLDPQAATLAINAVSAEGGPTPVLVQLTHEGEMLAGRYQEAVPGMFVTPPWSIDLAPGEWQLRISRGPQFHALEQTLQCTSGETMDLGSLELTRKADLPSLGWYAGDGDGDVYHGELIYNDVDAETAAHIGQAMGLDWMGVGRWGVSRWGGPNPKTWGDANAFMESLSGPRFLFMWTDEKPKTQEGHGCFVGLKRPDDELFNWGWSGGAKRPLRNFETLQMIRASGGATFANHPLRWWMKGKRFNTNMYSSLPFDLCAAGLLDGVNINDKPEGIQLWSMLLDHGYRVAATAGADFCLDRPSGPPPGLHRMYCYCPEGMSSASIAEAVRKGNTIVSTGPVLVAALDGQPPGTTVTSGGSHQISVQAWARGDQKNAPLQRLELWAHGRPIASYEIKGDAEHAETTFEWTPEGEWDWAAVRAVARGGWAMTSAFYAATSEYESPQPVVCRVTLEVRGLSSEELATASVELWDGVPSLVTAKKIRQVPLKGNDKLDVPVSATLVVRLGDGRQQQTSVYDAVNMSELIESIAVGLERESPLLEWKTYAEVLERVQNATVRIAF